MTEPEGELLATAMQALKQSASRHLRTGEHFWQSRYSEFNVYTERKRIEKLPYIHRNPVTRGLVTSPEQWRWSSFLQYAPGESGAVTVTPPWRVEPLAQPQRHQPHPSSARMGHPAPGPIAAQYFADSLSAGCAHCEGRSGPGAPTIRSATLFDCAPL